MRPRKLSLLLHTNSTTNVGRLSTLPTRNPTPDSKSPIYRKVKFGFHIIYTLELGNDTFFFRTKNKGKHAVDETQK